jgi:dTDP-4-amino-4,6-dideoxygalactose transaminase
MAATARECIYLALKLLPLSKPSRIGVQLFCCPCVFEAIVAAGHVPVFLDIDESTYGVSPVALAEVKDTLDALILVHTFGYPVNIEQIRASLGNRRIPIIEDCAHALFSEYQGNPIGTSTEMSVFSFGLRKPATAGGGGVLIVNGAALRDTYERMDTHADTTLQEVFHTMECLTRSIAYERHIYALSMLLHLPYGRARDGYDPYAHKCLPSGSGWRLRRNRITDTVHLTESINRFALYAATILPRIDYLRYALKDTFLMLPPEPSWGKWNHFWIPIRFPSAEQYISGQATLWERGLDAAPIWQHCLAQAPRFGYRGGCSQAEKAAKTVCRLPPLGSVSDDELEYICDSLRLCAPATRHRKVACNVDET